MNQMFTLESPAENAGALTIGVRATPSDYEITSKLPKVSPEDISVRFARGVLTVTARVEKEIFQNLSRILVVDRQYGCVEQGFALPADADPQSISADFDDGVLRVVVGRLTSAS